LVNADTLVKHDFKAHLRMVVVSHPHGNQPL